MFRNIAGINSREFKLQSDTCSYSTLVPTATCKFDVIFRLTSVGIKRANVKIQSNDPDTPVLLAPLRGSGVLD